jgi:hypothetical protein
MPLILERSMPNSEYWQNRLAIAGRYAIAHFGASILIAGISAWFIFGVWFPAPFDVIAGGTELFWLVVTVDVVCGPLLTLFLYDPKKTKRELIVDLGLVVLIQLIALAYGVWTVWQVRPLFIAHEHDRFKVVALGDLRGATTEKLPQALIPAFFKGPIFVSLREPASIEEKNKVLMEALQGGADYGDRPDFYLPFEDKTALKTLARSKKINDFLTRYPYQRDALEQIARGQNRKLEDLRYLPIRARNDWIAVLKSNGYVDTYLPGDGF